MLVITRSSKQAARLYLEKIFYKNIFHGRLFIKCGVSFVNICLPSHKYLFAFYKYLLSFVNDCFVSLYNLFHMYV
jgi:hypothetical protein